MRDDLTPAVLKGRRWGKGDEVLSTDRISVSEKASEAMPVLPQDTIKGLAEIVLRVRDLNAMQSFYGDVLGMTLLKRFGDGMAFFRLPNGSTESPQTLALFSEKWQANVPDAPWGGLEQSTTTLHHFTLSVSLPDLFEARELLKAAQVPTHDRVFPWAGWRSLMIADPERNVVELVASDPSIYEPIPA